MKKKVFLFFLPLLAFIALSCNLLTTRNSATPTSTSTVGIQLTGMPPISVTAILEWTEVASTTTSDMVIIDIVPENGSLVSQLAANAKIAENFDLKPVAEFGATWCPACVAIQESLDDHNPLMIDAFQGVYVIRIDVDQWDQSEIKDAGFDVPVIPNFFKLDGEGKPTSEVIDGNAWGDNIPENMAPPLKEFFNR